MGKAENSLFRENLRVFEAHSSLASQHHFETAGESRLSVEIGDDESPLWYYLTPDGHSSLLHSRRAPMREAIRQIDQWQDSKGVEWTEAVLVLGFAGMYHLEVIVNRMQQGTVLVVIEPDAALFREAIHHCDLRKLESGQRKLFFIVGNTPDETSSTLKVIFRELPRLDMMVYSHPASQRLMSEEFDTIKRTIASEARIEGMNRGTNASFSDEWVQNCLINYPILLKHPGVSALYDLFQDRPAVVVGAGPSLDKSLDQIRMLQGRAVIVSVGQALRSLLSAGIEPDFVVAVDSDPKTFKQFNGLPENGTWLLAGDNLYLPIVEQFSDRLFGFSNALFEMRRWLAQINALDGYLQVGGTVAISAIDAAAALGCDPIFLTGIDLAYLEDGTTHASKTQWETHKENPKRLVPVPGNYSETVLTSKQFAIYIDIMNSYLTEDCRPNSRTIYNATTGGAKLQAKLIRPDQMLELAPEQTEDFKEQIKAAHQAGTPARQEDVSRQYEGTMSEMTRLKELAERALEVCKKLETPYLTVERKQELLDELAEADQELKNNEKAMHLMNCAIMGACMHIMSSRQNEKDSKLSTSIQLYEQIQGAADWLSGLLERSLKEYEKE